MYGLLVAIHIFVSLFLVIVILMQSSKGGGLAGAFGGAGTSAVFGGRGAASFLQKLTTGLVVSFMVIAIMISFTSASADDESSIIQEAARESVSGPGASLPAPSTAPPLLEEENSGN